MVSRVLLPAVAALIAPVRPPDTVAAGLAEMVIVVPNATVNRI